MGLIIPPGVTSLTAYEWCNKHGLWRGPTQLIEAPDSDASLNGGVCSALHADFLRRQRGEPWNQIAPYTEADGAKHTPYITVTGSVATVTVGDGDPYHPMTASPDLKGQ